MGSETRRGVRSHEERVSLRKASQGNLLHRRPAELTCEGSVVHDPAATHVDAVVGKGKTGGNEVRAERRLLSSGQAESNGAPPVTSRDDSRDGDSLRCEAELRLTALG